MIVAKRRSNTKKGSTEKITASVLEIENCLIITNNAMETYDIFDLSLFMACFSLKIDDLRNFRALGE